LEIKQRAHGMTFFILTYIFVMAAKKMNFYPIPTYIFAMAAKKLNFYGYIFVMAAKKLNFYGEKRVKIFVINTIFRFLSKIKL